MLEQIATIFGKFERTEEKLSQIPKDSRAAVNKVMAVFVDGIDIFAKPEDFFSSLSEVSDVMGHCYHTVLEIELQRQKIDTGQSIKELLMPKPANQQQTELAGKTQPIIFQAATQPIPSNSPGWTGYLSERVRMKTLKEIVGLQKTAPEITTEKKPTDILDYCRDIPRECNRLYDYYQSALDMVEIYPDPATKGYLRSELRLFLGKLCNIIVGFTRAIVDYRTELLGYRETAYAQAITAMKQAEYMTRSPYISPFSPPSQRLGRRSDE